MAMYDYSNLPLCTLGLARRSSLLKPSNHDVEDTVQTQRTMNITNPEKVLQSIKSVKNLKVQMTDQILTDGPPKTDRAVKKRKRRKKKASKKSSQKRKSWNNGEDQLESKPQRSRSKVVRNPITVTIQEEKEQRVETESSRCTQLRRCIHELEGDRKRLSMRLREKDRQLRKLRKKMSKKVDGALEKELKKNGVLKRVFDLDPERVQHLITKQRMIKYQSRSAAARKTDESDDATTVPTYSNSKMQSPNTSRWISKFGPQNGLNAWTKVAEQDSPEEKGEDSAKEKKSRKSLKDEIKEYDSQQLMEWIRAYRNERHPLAKTLRDYKLFIERYELTGEELATWTPRDLADCLKVPPSDIQFKSIVARFQNDEYYRA